MGCPAWYHFNNQDQAGASNKIFWHEFIFIGDHDCMSGKLNLTAIVVVLSNIVIELSLFFFKFKTFFSPWDLIIDTCL